jgi:hypothetical protein
VAAAQTHARLLIATRKGLAAADEADHYLVSFARNLLKKHIRMGPHLFPPHFLLNSIFLPGTDGGYGQNALAS